MNTSSLHIQPFRALLTLLLLTACSGKNDPQSTIREDAEAKASLQGTWTNELEGNVVFAIKGDTIYYNDSTSTPVAFYVSADTLFIRNQRLTAYPIKTLTQNTLVFINSEGDETQLVKSSTKAETLSRGEHKGTVAVNQGRKIKRDSILVEGNKKYHAYTQVNPTTYKVYRQTTNNDGLIVESIYYDNIVYIAVYDGNRKVFGSNVAKADFAHIVPDAYLRQAVLSEIKIDRIIDGKMRFVAILSIPDSYTNYRVNIDIDDNGRKTLSV